MRPEHEQRFRRIVGDYLERPRGDYGELLHRGHVSSPEGVDPEQWRAEIRAEARRDKIRIITFRDGDHAVAARNRTVSDEEMRSELDRMQALRQLAAAARARRSSTSQPQHMRGRTRTPRRSESQPASPGGRRDAVGNPNVRWRDSEFFRRLHAERGRREGVGLSEQRLGADTAASARRPLLGLHIYAR